MQLDHEVTATNAAEAIEAAYQLRLARIGELTTYMVTAGDPQDCFVWVAACLRVATGADGMTPMPDPNAALPRTRIPDAVPLESQDRYLRMALEWARGDSYRVQLIYAECLGRPEDAVRVSDLMAAALLHARNSIIASRRVFQ